MLQRLTINLSQLEREALKRVAAIEFRDIRGEARLIIRQELERRGLLQPITSSVGSQEIQSDGGGAHVTD